MTQPRDGVEAVSGINHDDDTKDAKRQMVRPTFVIVVTSWSCL